jgi:hypothetical protein
MGPGGPRGSCGTPPTLPNGSPAWPSSWPSGGPWAPTGCWPGIAGCGGWDRRSGPSTCTSVPSRPSRRRSSLIGWSPDGSLSTSASPCRPAPGRRAPTAATSSCSGRGRRRLGGRRRGGTGHLPSPGRSATQPVGRHAHHQGRGWKLRKDSLAVEVPYRDRHAYPSLVWRWRSSQASMSARR